MAYPNTTNNLTGVTDKQPGVQQGTEWKSATVNPWVSEINAITVELGALPKAGYADVKARLDAIEAAAGGMPKINPAVAGNFPKQKADGTLEDSGYDAGDFSLTGHNHNGVYDPAGTAATAVSNHEAASDPHTGYQRESEKGTANGYAGLDAGGTVPTAQLPASLATDAEVATAISDHAAAADPHPGYQRESEKGAASGYASLDANAKVVEDPAAAATTAGVDKIPKAGTGGTIDKDFVPVMVGASASVAGAKGLVPAPAAGDQEKVLSGAGTWVAQSSGGGDNVSVNGSACADVDLDDDGVTATAGRALMEWKTSGSSPTKINCQTPASVPVVLDREINTTIGTSWTAALTHAVPAGAMGTNRSLRFTLRGYYRNWSGSAQNFYLRVKFGGTTMVEATMPMGISISEYRPLSINGTLTNMNATNTQAVGVDVLYTVQTGNPTTGYGWVNTSGFATGSLRGAATEDTTAAVTLEVALYRADASDVSLIIDHALLELL